MHRPRSAHLSGGDVSLLIDLAEDRPRVLYWGRRIADLSEADAEVVRLVSEPATTHNSTDHPRHFPLIPTEADGWSGFPGLEGNIVGGSAYPRLRLKDAIVEGGTLLRVLLVDDLSGLALTLSYGIDDSGIVIARASLLYEPDDPAAPAYQLHGITTLLPIPGRASELLDFTGKWSKERSPQRSAIGFGTHLREARRGRPSLDSPYLLAAGTGGFGFRSGEIWAAHLGWSGNQRYVAERQPEGAGGTHPAAIGVGELLLPGEISLKPGEHYEAPAAYFAWSDRGLDGISHMFHDHIRAMPVHPRAPRPIVLNTWEAVYFDHDRDKLGELVDIAARVGVERVVLDDGWFEGRRDATGGLGDWYVDRSVWPSGLAPLSERVRSHGMQFGLWFEPEMVNLGSNVIREHPDWLLAPSRGAGPAIRHQYVLNLGHPQAWSYLFDRIDEVVSTYSVDYIKWDHNRELLEAARRNDNDQPGVHTQTQAAYQLMDALIARHPNLEIESCASGGGRVDLGVLQRAVRVWASDTNDPLERQRIQRWTAQLIPLELIGSHLGDARAHTTGRQTDIAFRLATALFGHAGIELDLTTLDPDELASIAEWARLYKEVRGLLHSGFIVRADLDDPALMLHGVVSADADEALFSWVRLDTSVQVQSGRIQFPGLSTDRRYRVRIPVEAGTPTLHERPPAWMDSALRGDLIVSGVVLSELGLQMPTLNPQQALLLKLTAEEK